MPPVFGKGVASKDLYRARLPAGLLACGMGSAKRESLEKLASAKTF